MSKNKILVTGGSGMVGKHLKRIIPNAIYISSKDGDLKDPVYVEWLFSSYTPTIVIHLAARVGGIQENISKPAEFFDDNILINTNVLKMCKIYKVKRFIGMLSTCAYPDFKHPSTKQFFPLKEDLLLLGPPTLTNWEYAYTKRSMAVQIDAYNEQYKTKYN